MAERSGVIENQARDGARRSEAKSSVGEEIEPPVGTWGLIMENRGQSELKRFRAVSQMKKGFVSSILGTFPVFRGNGKFFGRFGILSRLRVNSSGKAVCIPKWGKRNVAE